MDFILEKHTHKIEGVSFNAFYFLPQNNVKDCVASFTHGYTSSKHSILSWGQRLAENGITTVLFDLPGHHLGGLHNVETMEEFINISPKIFNFVHEYLDKSHDINGKVKILGGHSLGALMSLKALENDFTNDETVNICVGFGLGPENRTHAFDQPLFKKTMDFRNQLVSPCLNSDAILPWIKEQKEALSVKGKLIHLLTGQDDVIVSEKGTEILRDILVKHNNDVYVERPKKLPHHQPDMAAVHVWTIIKKLIAEKNL